MKISRLSNIEKPYSKVDTPKGVHGQLAGGQLAGGQLAGRHLAGDFLDVVLILCQMK